MSEHIVCVPAFADNAASWRPLLEPLGKLGHDVAVADQAGARPATVAGHAAFIAEFVEREYRDPVTLVGHSLGSAIAVEAAHQLGRRCAGLVSLEGNLTPEDAYFSGLAADYPNPLEFKRAFTALVEELVAAQRAPATYAEAVAAADAETIWSLGRDARAHGSDGYFGLRYRNLTCPTRYLWAASTTPPATAKYLAQHQISAHRLPIEHHWPWQIAPAVVAEAIVA